MKHAQNFQKLLHTEKQAELLTNITLYHNLTNRELPTLIIDTY